MGHPVSFEVSSFKSPARASLVGGTRRLFPEDAKKKFDETVEDEADPGVDEKAQVELVRLVSRGCGQMWHEDKEIEQASEGDGGELLEQAGEHGVSFKL
jgi:hypothetical protein